MSFAKKQLGGFLVEWIYSLIGSIATIVVSIAILAYWLGKKFSEIDIRFREIDKKFETIDRRFESIDDRFREIDRRFERIELRLEAVEKRLGSLENKFSRLIEAIKCSQEFMTDFLAYEDVLRREAVDVLKRELSRLLSLGITFNPITKEELEKIKQLIEKDELTLEEAEELYRIADKLVREYGNAFSWKLLLYSRFWIGYNPRKMKEKRKSEKSRESS